jgi:hypothetical protein
MPPDGKKFRKDQIFDIITGFYPDIASKVHRTKKMGKGGVGQKYVAKRGYSDTTIEKYQTREEFMRGGYRKDLDTGEITSSLGSLAPEGIIGKKGGAMEGKQLWQKRKGVKGDPSKIWYKFTGGTDQYQLYGDQVWYMAGTQNPKDKKYQLTNYVRSVFGDKSPEFTTIYRKAENELIKISTEMAADIFDKAVSQVDENLKTTSRSPQSPMASEEMGYSEGDFQYMNHSQVLAAIGSGEIKDPDGSLAAQITKTKGSKANPADLYKIVTTGDKSTIELTQDVTEMDITDIGQHGITNLPPELLATIEEVKKGDEGSVNQVANLAKLKQGVIEMYNTAISRDYNPVILETKGLLINAVGGKGANWEKALKQINDSAGEGGSTGTGTVHIGAALGQEMLKTGMSQTSEKSSKQVAIEQVAHILGVMGSETGASIRQSHRVHTYIPSGIGVYASADLTIDDDMLFKAVDKDSVIVLEGYSASLAQEDLVKHGINDRGLATRIGQKRAYAASKVTGTVASGIGATAALAGLGLQKGLHPATVVHTPATGDMEDALVKLIIDGIPDISSKIGRRGKDKIGTRVHGLGKNRKLEPDGNFADTKFWALPYIGVLQSEYLEE